MITSSLQLLLLRHIQETYCNSIPSVDQIAHSIHERYPEYKRHKLPRFTAMVKKALGSKNSKGKQKSKRKVVYSGYMSNYDKDEVESTSPSSRSPKKAKKYDNREQSSSESESAESRSSSDDAEEDRSAVSMADDDVYSFEPEIDYTKMMLREKYSKSKLHRKVDQKPNYNSNDRETKKVDLTNIDGGVKQNKYDGDDADGKEDGPMFKDFGGMDDVLNLLKKEVLTPIINPEVARRVGFRPTVGILLHGPPGCGKTTLARAIANETGFPFYEVAASELVSGITGGSEEHIRELFSKAHSTAPSIIFIDEIDAIASKRENLKTGMERRIITQLMTCMCESSKNPSNKRGSVLVIGATNTADVLDSAVRRPGRFDREIALRVPDENARLQILKVITRDLRVLGDIDLVKISRATGGFFGADLVELVNQAWSHAIKRIMDERELELIKRSEKNEDWWKKPLSVEELGKVNITMLDFEVATKNVQASSKREGFSSIPDVKWEDVGGYDTLRREFDRYIVNPVNYPGVDKRLGLDLEMGFLLYGPPGCGKTLIAKAVASESGANFIYVKGPELLNKYVGEAESDVRKLFGRARTCSPCIVFFDEVDSLTTSRGKEGGSAVERIVTQLLTELDGVEKRNGVYVIGATNRPDMVDQALLRPGRFQKLMYVPLPTPDERGLILKALARNKPIDADVDLIAIGRSEACASFSGADLSALINEATMIVYEEICEKIKAARAANESQSSIDSLSCTVKAIHFQQALTKISPSVSDEQIQYYNRLPKTFKASNVQ